VFDILIRGGSIADGSGAPRFAADVGIEGDRITAVEPLARAEAVRTIEAGGLVVAPGFIDIHTHSDLTLLADGRGLSKVRQGVTTEVCGNCGYSPFPVPLERREQLAGTLSSIYSDAVEWTWTDLAGYRARAAAQGIGMNVAPLVGHSAIRGAVVGFEDRPADRDELRAMRRLLEATLEQGAFGFSTGLTLPPSAYGDTAEIVELARALSRYRGRFYTSHIRGWAGYHVRGVEEAVDVGRAGGVPVQVSHMSINDPNHWGEAPTVIAVCERAAAAGLDVTFDVYPYAASSSGFNQCLPTWAQSGGLEALVARLRDATSRARVRAAMLEEGLFRGWPWRWDRLRVSAAHTAAARPYEGLTIEQAAAALGLEPIDAALWLMDADDGRLEVIFYYRTEGDMRAFLRHPLGMVGSDGLAIAASGRLGSGKPHPRSYGAHARVLGRYVREEGVLALEEAVHKMSGKVADRLGLADRGRVRRGQAADLVLFDPAAVADRADFDDPHQYAAGVEYVLVNGRLTIERGEHTGAAAGRVLEAS
jgi:N-acyl-D-amino-acid deacylase